MPDKPTSYCEFVANLPLDDINCVYHDSEYGFPVDDDNELFGRLILEINQAGLSWTTVLKKQDNFRRTFDNFDIDKIASYGEADRERLLGDAGIIRNKLKVNAVIYNANQIVMLKAEFGSFKAWLDHYHPLEQTDWVKLFKKTFKFAGGEITKEFLMSTGYLPGAHIPECPILQKIKNQDK